MLKIVRVCPAYVFVTGKGYKELVATLLAHKANVNARDSIGETALVWAIDKKHREIVEILLNKGADPNTTFSYSQRTTGFTPLILAATLGHKEIVEMLIVHKADVTTQDNRGRTALSLAAGHGNKEIVEMLIALGVNVNTQDNIGWTAA